MPKVLFIGGTGTISEACTALAHQRGFDLYLLNRAQRDVPVPPGVKTLQADVRDKAQLADAVKGHTFDVVVNWISFIPQHVETDLEIFGGRVGQYIFISSASAYQKPPVHYRITESTPLANPYWEYSRNKIACELRLLEEYRRNGFPVTIVRPSYTYGCRLVPVAVGPGDYTIIDRMRHGKPIIVHGDGQSLWTMTHNSDFAKGFVGLLGNVQTAGEAFHITSDEVLTWDQIYRCIAAAAGVEAKLVHIPSEFINAFDPYTGANLLGDKACSMVFDNSKLRRVVPDFVATTPFAVGIRQTVEWYQERPERMRVDDEANAVMDRIIVAHQRAWPS